MENLAQVHPITGNQGPSRAQAFVADNRGKLGIVAGAAGTLVVQKVISVAATWWVTRKARKAAEAELGQAH